MSDTSEYQPTRPPTFDAPVHVGQSLGKYELVRMIGEGAMGQVFLGRHALLGREVALKVLRSELARHGDLVVRFIQEARTVNQINHANIVQIFDFVQEPAPTVGAEPRVYCVMELLGGKSLSEWFRNGELRVAEIVQVMVQVCQALAAAHAVGVIHRDIKPDNIIVERRDGAPWAKVVDFGVAKLTRADGKLVETTQAGAVIGTPLYMSPEQAAGLEATPQSDVYALGAVMYEGLSGHTPFQATSFGMLAAQLIRDAPPALPATTPTGERIPEALAALVQHCLAKLAEDRPATTGELAAQLGASLGDGAPRPAAPLLETLDGTDRSRYEAFVAPRRKRTWLAAGIAGGALTAAGLVFALWPRAAPIAPLPVIAAAPSVPALAATPLPEPSPAPPAAPVPEANPAPKPAPATDAEQKPGQLAVVSVRNGRPFFAAVYLDGARLGDSPIERAIPAGRHTVRVEREGMKSQERAVQVRSGETTRVRVELGQ